jgi:tetratricopeptide (TPR) repeat protein
MLFARIWHRVRGKRRQPTSGLTFRRAQRLRDEGRYRRAAGLVDEALLHDPRSVVGHLLAASLHMVLRETGQARISFERVLALEPTQPRALLGLARVELEDGQTAACCALLNRALARYPDFPEARALLEVARELAATADARRDATSNGAAHADRLRLPAESREALFVRADATVIVAEPSGPRIEAVAARAVKLAGVATAMLGRAGLGPLRRAVIEGAAETTYLRRDDAALLTLSFDRDMKSATALEHLERVWRRCRSELA